MATQGLHDRRTRVTFLIPLNNEGEENAIHDVIAYLEQQRTGSLRVTGFTRSKLAPTTFTGYWWVGGKTNETENLKPEEVVLFIIDYECTLDDRRLSPTLEGLRQSIDDAYFRHTRQRQKEIWIIAQEAVHYVKPKRRKATKKTDS